MGKKNSLSIRTALAGMASVAIVGTAISSGCAGHHLNPPKSTPTPSATPTGRATPTPSATPTASPTATPTATPSGTASGTPTPAPTPSISSLTLSSQLQVLNQAGNTIDNVVLRGIDDAWVVTYDNDHWAASDLPVDCAGELARLTSGGLTIGPIALGPSGSWVVVNGTNQFRSSGIATDLYNILATASTSTGQKITALAIGPDSSYVVVLNGTDYRTAGVPNSLSLYLQSAAASGLTIARVALGTNGSWVVITQSDTQTNPAQSSGIPPAFTADLTTIAADKDVITGVALGAAGSFAVTYDRDAYFANATRAASGASRLSRP